MKPSPVLTAEPVHLPVLLKETVELLSPPPDGVVLDLTVGMGGHSQELLKFLPNGRLVGLDQDVDAIQHAGRALRKDPRVSLYKANFADLLWVLRDLSISEVDSVLMDIGVSSLQLDTAHRGFSFNREGPLDMRMDTTTGHTAAYLLNTYPEDKLSKVIYEYGEEPKARALARAIVKAREQKPIETTGELADLAKRICGKPRHKRGESSKHPATRLFQALRIEVNRELEVLEKALKTSVKVLKPGGRIAVISFHSLEDRIVKQFFKTEATDCLCPPAIPQCICGHKASLEIVTGKPVTASPEELAQNPRARSAKLRVARKLHVKGAA
ncbi:MAG TPA: 16S rRNA (cytosine(1402)-N(4))-methyltransferase RsmH [bacterium]|nr:16S rRNA (cytosine(1402)-N(4))-methyltransferase RsmH [bacterium]